MAHKKLILIMIVTASRRECYFIRGFCFRSGLELIRIIAARDCGSAGWRVHVWSYARLAKTSRGCSWGTSACSEIRKYLAAAYCAISVRDSALNYWLLIAGRTRA